MTKNDFIETISNVFYIPDLKTNLLSASQLQDNEYRITFFKGDCEVYDPKRYSIAMIKITLNKLFPLKIKKCTILLVCYKRWLIFVVES